MLPHAFPQRLNSRCSIALQLRLLCASFLLPLPLHLDLYEPLIIAMRAGLSSIMFNCNDDFRTVATVLENVWGEVAWFPGSCSFSDCVASCAD